MLLPLAIGIVLKAYREDLAALVKPLLDAISNVSLVPIVALILLLNIDKVLHIFGSHGIMAGVLLTILGVGVGWLVGGANADTRRVLTLSTGRRNFAVALVLASQSFDDPRVEIMVIVAAVVGLLIVLPVCWAGECGQWPAANPNRRSAAAVRRCGHQQTAIDPLLRVEARPLRRAPSRRADQSPQFG